MNFILCSLSKLIIKHEIYFDIEIAIMPIVIKFSKAIEAIVSLAVCQPLLNAPVSYTNVLDIWQQKFIKH